MDLGLKDKVAAVAAASSGLGKAVALGLSREGARVFLCSRSRDRAEAAAAEIRAATGGLVLALEADVTRKEDADRFIREAVEHCGRLDILVTNTGGPPAGYFPDFSEEDWLKAVRLNLLSAVLLTQSALPHMQRQRWGRIIYMTSIAVKQPVDNLILSNSVRLAVVGMAKTLSNQLALDNILINCVCPGYTRTERLDQLARHLAEKGQVDLKEILERWEKNVPMHRLGEPEEFANLVVFLASERASYITGTAIQVDGGLVQFPL